MNRTIVGNTFLLGLLVGVIGTALRFLLAYVQVMVRFKGKKIMHLLCLLPVVSPTFARTATAVITLLGRGIDLRLVRLETNIYGLPGPGAGAVLLLVALLELGMLENLDPALDDAATTWSVALACLLAGHSADARPDAASSWCCSSRRSLIWPIHGDRRRLPRTELRERSSRSPVSATSRPVRPAHGVLQAVGGTGVLIPAVLGGAQGAW